jgi:hypothetical protein
MFAVISTLSNTSWVAIRAAEGGDFPGPTIIGPQHESESLKLSRFFKLVRAFLKLTAPCSGSTCSLAKVYLGD